VGNIQLLKGDVLAFNIGVKYPINGRVSSGTVPVRSREPLPVLQTVASYCADEVMSLGKSLEAGWQITEFCQDSAGRRRTATYFRPATGASGKPRLIEIADPVANVIYRIVPEKREATRMKGWTTGGVFGGVLGGIIGSILGGSRALEPKVTTEFAGVKTMEGLEVYGSVRTTVYPSGYQGATQEVIVIGETWYSPAIKRTVLRTIKNSRTGETHERLENVRLGEPDPALFQLPVGYDVVDAR
jgi:hypothetical protein